MENILITGVAGFIGSAIARQLVDKYNIIGLDNLDPYYDPSIKKRNLDAIIAHQNFTFIEGDILSIKDFNICRIDLIIHLASKAGVRPSIEDPMGYYQTNVLGTLALMEWAKDSGIKKVIYASSSSVYGNNIVPFSEEQKTDCSISYYASSKKSCELLLHNYFHLYDINCVILRFFTVYGPGQRPDLAIHKFVDRIEKDETIDVYGIGGSSRDYTFIDDIVNGIEGSIKYIEKSKCFEVFNLGGNHPIKLMDLLDIIQKKMGKTAKLNYLPMQEGDVERTYANIDKAKTAFNYSPSTSMEEGIGKFIDWYRSIH